MTRLPNKVNGSQRRLAHSPAPATGAAAASSLPENDYQDDDEDNDAKRDIHIILSLLMMAHPSPFTDYQALSVPCGFKRVKHAGCPAAAHNA